MLSVSCRDVGVDCDFRGSGETEEELMNNLVDHAIKDHGYTREYVMKPEMQEKIKAKIKKSWKYDAAVGSQLSILKYTDYSFIGFFMLFEIFGRSRSYFESILLVWKKIIWVSELTILFLRKKGEKNLYFLFIVYCMIFLFFVNN